MKPIFHHKPVNGPFEDPAVFVRILREKRALLLDAGDISPLATADIMKISDVFVTHMHMDHFIGFDTLLRALLWRDSPITFYGPQGITACIQGKLQGYTWNVISAYPLIIHVSEIKDDIIMYTTFKAANAFRPTDQYTRSHRGPVLENDLFFVSALNIEHGVPSLGFSIKEKIHINIDKAGLCDRGLHVGPWLNRLKQAVRNGNFHESIDTGMGIYKVSELEDIYVTTKGQKVGYIMDTSPFDRNIERIVPFVAGSDALYIEAYFLKQDMVLARDRNHLTAELSGYIAKEANVKQLLLLHFSPRYNDRQEALVKEAHAVFSETS